MRVIVHWLTRLVAVALVATVCSVAVAYWLASRSIPDYDADWTVPGLDAPVEIVRNTAAVPHIFGLTDHDVYYGLGFVHAQDRLWQMLMYRRTAQGRLSEVFGPRTLEIDDLMRRLDLDGYATRSLDAFSDESLGVLQAYADGVNAWMRLVGDEALGRGAPELFLFEPEIAPWRPNDTVALSLLLAFELTRHPEHEVLRARTSLALPDPDRLADILPDAPGAGAAELGDLASLLQMPRSLFADTTLATDPRHPLHPHASGRTRGGASNVWAAIPDRSAAGGALMASDPHVNLTAPSSFYLARLDLATGL